MAQEISSNIYRKILGGLLYRLTALVGLAAVAYALYVISEATIDPQLRVKNAELETEPKRVQKEIAALKRESSVLQGEVERLKGDADEIAYHARNGLGMIRSGEVIYRFDNRTQAGAKEER